MSIPDAAVEAAAEALYATGVPRTGNLTTKARAAIEAAMPAIREALAQEIEADESEPNWTSGDFCGDYNIGWDQGVDHAVRIVRGGTP